MSWVAVDANKDEWIYEVKPERFEDHFVPKAETSSIELRWGSIKKLIGKEITWEDEPVEIVT